MNRRILVTIGLAVFVPLFAGCSLLHSNVVPPAPKVTGIKAQNLAWHNAIHRRRHGELPTFGPLTAAKKAVHAAQSQDQVKAFDSQSLTQAEQSLAAAEKDWQAIAGKTKSKRSDQALAQVAAEAHRAQRLAEIAQYTAQRHIARSKVASLKAAAQRRRRRQARLARQRQQKSLASRSPHSAGRKLVGHRVVPSLLGPLQFQSGTARLTQSSRPVVGRLAKLLAAHPKLGVALFGFTDNTAPPSHRLQAFVNSDAALKKKNPSHKQEVQAYHQALSQARARDVAELLVQAGVDQRRIGARGMGASHPIASNSSAAGRQKNERVEAIMVPLKKNGG